MQSVRIAEFKAKMGSFLRLVRSGIEVVLTDRGHPVARVTPYVAGPVTKLPIRKPIRNPQKLARLSFAPKKGRRTDSVAALLEDRRSR
ncbi:MAG: type II toxin-antitoxin system prevent-host-death family antitoxin [Planctomycetota bacterium]